ncbi:transglutaminase-like putative cysteine protease [Gelidibacter sediminis]|uniref:Transglutaminase-like putative cysteine protease n=1 Tax=Gelidibacter sediminis TaxID=1608710 RepID=A0A4R7QA43_9FLAO|nr:DUF3857 domain-containing protein [Gelidibacter sediminis]TDU43892.1 transglutaminase-like putative cysteine protease [Gelidibacter sediminis]
MIKIYRLIFVLVFPILCVAQDEKLLSSYTIPTSLRENANAVVRLDDNHIEVKSYNKMVFTNKRIVTILNSSGNSKVGTAMGYDDNISIKKMEARIYNSAGDEIKKIKKNDFEDMSAVPGGTLYSDSRVKYLRYTPIDYPYTVLFETEVEYSSTGFIPGWRPIEGYFTSTENATYKISNPSGVDIKTKTNNFEAFGIEKIDEFSFKATNLSAIQSESYSPDFYNFAPLLKATLTKFEMEGVDGSNVDWKDFGKWMNEALILDTQELPADVKVEIKSLTASATSDIEKAKIVYQYMQNKTRYISVQVGIGGWKPMLASDVHRLGYGDCKGLTNYTKALLNEIGVESYYTVIHGGSDIKDIDASFSSIQGNHVILALPTDDDYIWLECTSQTVPFGFNANFTDDRAALILTPEGGKIVHTKVYTAAENLLDTNAQIVLTATGDINAHIIMNSYGTQYGHHEGIQNKPLKEQALHYKDYWNYINNLEIEAMTYKNDKDSIVFTETINLEAAKYASKTGNRLLLSPNLFNVLSAVPPRYRDRKLPFEIERGFHDRDSYTISIPEDFEVEALQEPIHLKTQFGEYESTITQTSQNSLVYNRIFTLNKGAYEKEDYEAFREFWLEIVKHDKSRIILKSKS